MWELDVSQLTLWVSMVCYRDSFTSFFMETVTAWLSRLVCNKSEDITDNLWILKEEIFLTMYILFIQHAIYEKYKLLFCLAPFIG
jgi:hypothetical protein